MKISIIIPQLFDGADFTPETSGLRSLQWPTATLQKLIVQVGSPGHQSIPKTIGVSSETALPPQNELSRMPSNTVNGDPDANDVQLFDAYSAHRQPSASETLNRCLPHCDGDVIVWYGGKDYPVPAIRWLAEATTRFDFVVAEPSHQGIRNMRRRWTTFHRRRNASSAAPRRPALQYWAGLRDVIQTACDMALPMREYSEGLQRRGYRTGRIQLNRVEAHNTLSDRLAGSPIEFRPQQASLKHPSPTTKRSA